MSKLTKNQKLYNAKVETGKAYTLEEAAALVKEITFTKFDASTDIDVRLGVDPRKANQMVRGVVSLPHGTGKQVRVLVLCGPDAEAAAKEAGADYVGLEEYIDKIDDLLSSIINPIEASDRSYLTVAIGCTGGYHRSVYIAQTLADRFNERGTCVKVRHRSLLRDNKI